MPPARARLLSIYNPQAWYGAGQFFAPNPDFGAAIDYYLRDARGGRRADRRSRDAGGKVVRTLRAPARAASIACRGICAWSRRSHGDREAAGAGGFGGPPTGTARAARQCTP